MLYAEPVVAVFTAWVWLQELPSILSLFGGLIAIFGVIIVNGVGIRWRPARKKVG